MVAKRHIGETSYKETSFGIIPRSKLIPLEIEGITRAWDFILEIHEKKPIPLTVSFIKKVHLIGFGWIFPDIGGKFRTIEVRASKHTPPKYYQVPQLMEDFVQDVSVRLKYISKVKDVDFVDKLIELIAWAHHRFLWIHPFQDYNGRVARLLNNIILLRCHFPPIELKVESLTSRKVYINALQQADTGSFEALQKLIKQALEEAARDLK